MKIVWALNPFDKNTQLQKKAASLLRSIRGARTPLIASYVASATEIGISTAFNIPEEKRFTEYPLRLLKKAIKASGLKNIEAKVLVEPTLSLTLSVKTLLEDVKKQGASLIVMPTNAHTGIKRLVLGSFAETLVHYSSVDVLFFNVATKVSRSAPKTLLYAHDFSKKGDLGLEKAVSYAKLWNAHLSVLHIPSPSFSINIDGQVEEVLEYRKLVDKKMASVKKALEASGVSFDLNLNTEWKYPGDLILSSAKKAKTDLILTVAQTSPRAALLIGSVTKYIMKNSKLPTLVMKV